MNIPTISSLVVRLIVENILIPPPVALREGGLISPSSLSLSVGVSSIGFWNANRTGHGMVPLKGELGGGRAKEREGRVIIGGETDLISYSDSESESEPTNVGEGTRLVCRDLEIGIVSSSSESEITIITFSLSGSIARTWDDVAVSGSMMFDLLRFEERFGSSGRIEARFLDPLPVLGV